MAPMIRKVGATPVSVGDLKYSMSARLRFDPTNAPPPNPMIANPVAMPGRSGYHFTSVDTGAMYPRPRPQPPTTPYPRYTSQS